MTARQIIDIIIEESKKTDKGLDADMVIDESGPNFTTLIFDVNEVYSDKKVIRIIRGDSRDEELRAEVDISVSETKRDMPTNWNTLR